MKKKNTKVKKAIEWLDFGIFPGYAVFCYNMSYKEIVKKLKKKKTLHWYYGIENEEKSINSGNWLALSKNLVNEKTGEQKKLFYIVISKEFDFSDYDYAKLAHEITHLCQFYLPNVLDRNREFEAEAYLHTHLMMQCLKIMRGTNESKS